MDYISDYLSIEDNVKTVTEKHLRSKALVGQQDDSVDVSRKSEEMFEVGKLIDIWQQLMNEKEQRGRAMSSTNGNRTTYLLRHWTHQDIDYDRNKV